MKYSEEVISRAKIITEDMKNEVEKQIPKNDHEAFGMCCGYLILRIAKLEEEIKLLNPSCDL